MDYEARQDEREGDDTTRRNQDPLKKILRRDVMKYQRTIFGQIEERAFEFSRHGKLVWIPIVGTKGGMVSIEKAGRVAVAREAFGMSLRQTKAAAKFLTKEGTV
jgi:hypothetical protein